MTAGVKELRQLMRLMRKEGVTKLQTGDLYLEMDINHVPRGTMRKQKDQVQDAPLVDERAYTEEQVLMWSAPGIDPIEG